MAPRTFVGVILGSAALASCEFLPGTEAHALSQAKEAAASKLIDPSSAQFRNVRVNGTGETVCGEINGKNRMGAYAGFTKFWVSSPFHTVSAELDPEFDNNRLNQLRALCQSMRTANAHGAAYGLTINDSNTCSEADEYEQVRANQVSFDKTWWSQCYYNGNPPKDHWSVSGAFGTSGQNAGATESIAGSLKPDSHFYRALEAARLDGTLKGPGPFTVLVPDDRSFDQLSKRELASIMESQKSAVPEGIIDHVLPGKLLLGDISLAVKNGGGKAKVFSLEGKALSVTKQGERLVFTDRFGRKAILVEGDLERSNGVVHRVDGVLGIARKSAD